METKEQKAQRFKTLCIGILAQSGNCQDSQRDFNATDSIQAMCGAWHKYWHGMITEVPQQVVAAFDEFYPDFKAEINEAGIFYNEDSRQGIIIVGNSSEPIHLYFARNAYILGKAHVILHNDASAIGRHPDCKVELLDNARATVQQGYGIARNRSTLTINGDAECYNSSNVRITDGTLTDHGHYSIQAFGTAVINTFTDRNITLFDKAEIHLD